MAYMIPDAQIFVFPDKSGERRFLQSFSNTCKHEAIFFRQIYVFLWDFAEKKEIL